MIWKTALVSLVVFATPPAWAASTDSASVQVGGSVTFVQTAGIQVTNNLTFQTQLPPTITTPTLAASLSNSAPGASGAPAVTLTGGAADAVSLSVPAALELSREGSANGTVQMAVLATDGRAVLVSGLNRDGTLSVDLTGRVTLAGTVVEPGAYEGLLLVIAQYN